MIVEMAFLVTFELEGQKCDPFPRGSMKAESFAIEFRVAWVASYI